MALIHRVNRLFRADLHAVLDRLEEPELMLRQALRDMEDELAQAATRLKAAEAEREQLRQRITAIEAALSTIAGELDLCFAAGNEALIRTLLRRRLESERLLQLLQRSLSAAHRKIDETHTQLAERRTTFEQLRQRAMLLSARHKAADTRQNFAAVDDLSISEADIDLALLREQEQRRVS